MAEDITLFAITGIYSMLILSLSLSFVVGIRIGQVMKKVEMLEKRIEELEKITKKA